jgi:hypothetical protein
MKRMNAIGLAIIGLSITANSSSSIWEKDNFFYHPSGVESSSYHQPAYADLDDDGDYDLVIGDEEGMLIYYENQGDHQAPLWREHAGILPDVAADTFGYWLAPTLADLDGDSDLDLVIGERMGTVGCYWNIGSAGSPDWSELDTTTFAGVKAGSFCAVPALCDLDADGDHDLVLGERDALIAYYENIGTPHEPIWRKDSQAFGDLVFGYFNTPVLYDMDGDKDSDLVVGRRGGDLFFSYENTGTPQSPEWTPSLRWFEPVQVDWHSAPAVCDLDSDGDPDLTLGEENGVMSYYRNDGAWQWTDDSARFAGIDVGFWSTPVLVDLDADHDLDLIIGEDEGELILFRNQGGQPPRWRPVKDAFAHVAHHPFAAPTFGDLDGDGDLDLVIGELSGALHCYRNDGNPWEPDWIPDFSLFQGVGVAEDAAPALADVDSDGDLDLALGSWDDGVTYYQNTGTPTQPQWSHDPDMFAHLPPLLRTIPTFADLNGDGIHDLVVGEFWGTLWAYLQHRVGSYPLWIPDTTLFEEIDVGSYSAPALADMDGDSDLDLTVGEYAGNIGFYRNTIVSGLTTAGPMPLQVRTTPRFTVAPSLCSDLCTISCLVPDHTAPISVRIYDPCGRLIRSLTEGTRGATEYHLHWDTRDEHGRSVSNGPYFVGIVVGERFQSHKILLLR